MNAQEIFDKVVAHLKAQRRPSVLPDRSMCAYRSADGCKCAFGVFISDEGYIPELEGSLASDILAAIATSNGYLLKPKEHILLKDEIYVDLKPLVPFMGLISDLQNVHDRAFRDLGTEEDFFYDEQKIMDLWGRELSRTARTHWLAFDTDAFLGKTQ